MLEVHVNFASADEASAVARDAVQQRLAACANIHSAIRSFYWWDDAVPSEEEVPVIFKTSEQNLDALTAFIADSHSYETPSIIVHQPHWVHASYIAWVERESRQGAS